MTESVKSDIEIAQAAQLLPIQEIGAKLEIAAHALVPYGHDKAKIRLSDIKHESQARDGNPRATAFGS